MTELRDKSTGTCTRARESVDDETQRRASRVRVDGVETEDRPWSLEGLGLA